MRRRICCQPAQNSTCSPTVQAAPLAPSVLPSIKLKTQTQAPKTKQRINPLPPTWIPSFRSTLPPAQYALTMKDPPWSLARLFSFVVPRRRNEFGLFDLQNPSLSLRLKTQVFTEHFCTQQTRKKPNQSYASYALHASHPVRTSPLLKYSLMSMSPDRFLACLDKSV